MDSRLQFRFGARPTWFFKTPNVEHSYAVPSVRAITPVKAPHTMKRPNSANAIVVAGMHRSGTSALSRTLNLVGCDLPRTPIVSDNRGNEYGHWESQRIFELNDDILASAGSRWDDWEPVSADWYASPRYPEFFEKACEALAAEFESSRLFVFKDPRVCRLMRLWINVIESLNASPLIVMPVRNPRDVAASLERRNGIDASIGRLMWLRHVLDAEVGSRQHPRVTISFDDLLTDWRRVVTRIGKALDLSWPKLSTATNLDVDGFLSPDLRHHQDPRHWIERPDEGIRWITQAYDILHRWSADDEQPADLATLDEIRSNINALAPLFGRPVLLGQRAHDRLHELEAENGRLHDRLANEGNLTKELRQTAEQAEAKAKSLSDALADETSQQKTTIKNQGQRIASLDDALANARNQVASLMAATNERDQRLAALMQSSSWRVTAPLRSIKLRVAWLFRKSARAARLVGWICTGKFRQTAHALLPFYRRYAPRWVGSIIPHRLRRWLWASASSPSNAVLQSLTGDPVRPHPASRSDVTSGTPLLASKQVVPLGPEHVASANGIRFPATPHPDVSVVIPVYGHCHLTLRCLKSLSDSQSQRSFEVILVDDASTDDSAHALPDIPGICYLRNDRNLGFLLSCNRGAALARGRYILLLNNDTVVQDGAIDALANTFEEHDKVGLAGAKLYFEDGSLQEAGGIVWSDGSAMNFGRGDDPRKPEYNYVRGVDYCTGAAIMLPTQLWRQLDGFDSYYQRAYYEDTDLAFRVREAGYRVVYQPFAKVVHREGGTSGSDLSQGEKRYQVENQARFLSRWRKTLERDHAAPSTDAQVAKDRRAKGRVLVIDWVLPMADRDSGSVDTVNLIRMLGRMGMKTTFVPHHDLDYQGSYTDDLQRLGAEVLYAPFCDSLSKYLSTHGRRFGQVIVHRVNVFEKLATKLKALCPNARIIFNTVDLHHIREARQAEIENSNLLRKRAETTKRAELRLARNADATVVVSSTEQELLQAALPEVPVFHLPLVREAPGVGAAAFESRSGIAFLGNYQHSPNVDAILRFVHDVWPEIRLALPSADLLIFGAHITPEVAQLGDLGGVQTLGYVEDLAALYNRTRLTVAPLRYGAGAKGKVASSLCHGVPVIASPIAAEGMDVEHGREILIARVKSEWVEHVHAAYSDPDLWQTLSQAGVATMRRNHSLTAGMTRLSRILDLEEGGDSDDAL